MRRRAWWTFGIIVVIAALAAMVAWPHDVWFVRGIRIKPGLDVKGGTQLVYQLDTSELESGEVQDAIDGVTEAIRRRIDAFGVTEPSIYVREVADVTAVNVELPGVQDVQQAKELIGRTANLEFWQPATEGEEGARASFFGLFKPTELDGAELEHAQVTFQSGHGGVGASEPVVQIDFNSEGKELFGNLTRELIGQPIAVYLDDELITAPTVQAAITDGTAIITGSFDVESAQQLAIQLNAGALPVPVNLIEERTIGATLGNESVQASILAGIIGLFLVGLFMTLYYRLIGLLASVALLIYVTMTLGLYELLSVTFTVAGVAGFILSIGIAVDANVLIFERFREEKRAGNPTNLAIEEGFRRAWTSIRDSNLSSLITAGILFYTTTSLVQSFAVTFAVGILVSMFSAITVTRTLMRLALPPGEIEKGSV